MLPESDSYRVRELMFLDRPDTMPRYMRAAKWKFEDAKNRIKGTMEWRRTFKPDLIAPEDVRYIASSFVGLNAFVEIFLGS